jgi:hypothetical protein
LGEAEVVASDNLLDNAKASASTLEMNIEAKEAFFDDDFNKALGFLTGAIEAGPLCAQLFSDRAQVHIKMGSYDGMPKFAILHVCRKER